MAEPTVAKPAAKRKRKGRGKATCSTAHPDVAVKTEPQQPFRLLDLSPELRNHVYEYAVEDFADPRFAHRDLGPTQIKRFNPLKWDFFALTQTCRQIRAEYRPLWFRESRIFVCFRRLNRFIETFLPSEVELKNGPRLFQLLWEHAPNCGSQYDITPLLRLRAHRLPLRCEFIPDQLASGMFPDDDVCMFCFETYHLEEHDMESHYNIWEECTCPPLDLTYHEWAEYVLEQIDYADVFCAFVHHINEAWLNEIREGNVTVQCRFASNGSLLTFRILCTQPVCASIDDSKPALELLHRWGLFDLPAKSQREFVVAYEGEVVATHNGYEVTNKVVHETRFTAPAA